MASTAHATIYFTPEELDSLDHLCRDRGQRRSSLVRELVRKELESEGRRIPNGSDPQ